MKPEVSQWLGIELPELADIWNTMSRIEIIFQQNRYGGEKRTVIWTPGSTYPCKRVDNVLYIKWSREDTRAFKQNEYFYIDIRPTTRDGIDIPIEPLKEKMSWTLFNGEEDI